MGEQNFPESKARDETMEVQRVALYAFVINLALSAVKAALASSSGSLTVTASAIDSATDCLASLLLYLGLRLSSLKSPSFPLGLYKIENVASVVVGLSIFFAGYEIARHALTAASQPPEISVSVVVFFVAATLIIFFFGQYALRVGNRTGSPTLVAEGRHRQEDVLSSGVALVSVVMSYAGLRIELWGFSLDQMAAALVVLFVVHAGWGLLADGMRVLLDASIDFETLGRVEAIIRKEPAVTQIHSLVGRNAGRFRFLQAAISLRTDDLRRAHMISKSIERRIRSKVPNVERVLIHYEPEPRPRILVAVPLADRSGAVSSHFGESPYFAFVSIRASDSQVEHQEILPNPHREMATAKGIRVAEWLVEQQVDELVVTEEIRHKGPGYVLSNAGIVVHTVSVHDLTEAIGWVLSQGE